MFECWLSTSCAKHVHMVGFASMGLTQMREQEYIQGFISLHNTFHVYTLDVTRVWCGYFLFKLIILFHSKGKYECILSNI